VLNGACSTNRLYRDIGVYEIYRAGLENTIKQYTKPKKLQTLFGLGSAEMIPSPRLSFLGGVLLANHLASTDNLTRTTKRQNIYQRILTIQKTEAIITSIKEHTQKINSKRDRESLV